MATITLDPATRLEGHLKVQVQSEAGKVLSAQSSGTMFRGFEMLLAGKDPRDAVQVTQRVCGVCPISHAMAAVLALEAAANLRVYDSARILRTLILGADYLHSHLLQFYHLSLPSYVSFKGTALDMPPWTPAYEVDLRFDVPATQQLVGHYAQSLSVRRQATRWKPSSPGPNPSQGLTQPNPEKPGAYSWLKAPLCAGVPYEVGPLARMWVNGDYRRGISVMDRHQARALEGTPVANAAQPIEVLRVIQSFDPCLACTVH